MKIYTWNVNGIRAVVQKGFLDWLEAAQPDILCLQETKAWPEQLPAELLLALQQLGYSAHWHSAEKKGYSSVATLCRSTAQPAAQVQLGLQGEEHAAFDREGRLIISEHPGFTLFNAYFPNGQHDLGRVPFKLDFYRALLAEAQRRRAAGQRVIITGDWNTAHREIDLKNPKANRKNTGFLPEECAMIDHYLDQGYLDIFRQRYPDTAEAYTWWSYRSGARERNIGWRLDYFLIVPELEPLVRDSVIHADVHGSDHCPVSLELEL